MRLKRKTNTYDDFCQPKIRRLAGVIPRAVPRDYYRTVGKRGNAERRLSESPIGERISQ
jgi:hypothetical protein